MTDVLKVASYLCQRYKDTYGVQMDEMKLHKLLYFTQREAIIQTGAPMFHEKFKAWKYGPVLPQIRKHYKDDTLHYALDKCDVENTRTCLTRSSRFTPRKIMEPEHIDTL